MAKSKTQTPDNEPSALATVDDAATLAGLADEFDALGIDGLEDFGGEDIKLGVLLWNMRPNTKDKNGNPLKKDVIFNTVTEETADNVDLEIGRAHV